MSLAPIPQAVFGEGAEMHVVQALEAIFAAVTDTVTLIPESDLNH